MSKRFSSALSSAALSPIAGGRQQRDLDVDAAGALEVDLDQVRPREARIHITRPRLSASLISCAIIE
jgi:hypothetical protein